jgi:hypothetical protein
MQRTLERERSCDRLALQASRGAASVKLLPLAAEANERSVARTTTTATDL